MWSNGLGRGAVAASLALGLVAGAQIACDGTDCATCPPARVCPTPAPTPVPTPDYNGFWRGEWAPRNWERLSFTISDNANVRNVVVDFTDRTRSDCYYFGVSKGVLAGPFPIVDGRVTVDPGNNLWAVAGTIVIDFTNENTASARLSMTHAQPSDPCYGHQFTLDTTVTKRGW
jgi:hypothetical protein